MSFVSQPRTLKRKVLPALYSSLSKSMAQSSFANRDLHCLDQVHFSYLSCVWELKYASSKGRKGQGKSSMPTALCISFSQRWMPWCSLLACKQGTLVGQEAASQEMIHINGSDRRLSQRSQRHPVYWRCQIPGLHFLQADSEYLSVYFHMSNKIFTHQSVLGTTRA